MRYSWYINKEYMHHIPVKYRLVYVPKTKEKDMSSELEDLEKIYRDKLQELDDCIEGRGTYYRMVMAEYLKLHKERDAVKEKLDNLLEKMGKSESDGDEDDQDDEDGGE